MNRDIEKRLEKLEEQTAAGDDPPWFLELTGGKTRDKMTNEDWNSEAFIDQFFPDEVKQ